MQKINTLIEDLKNIYGENLVSAVLYGQAVNAELSTKGTEANIIVILNKLDASDLKAAHPAIKKWQKTKQPLPVFMGKDEWYHSTDIYPMEYTDIKKRHKILHGENVIEGLNIKKCNLRLQCEYELKSQLIALRENYLGKSDDVKYIQSLIQEASGSFSRLFRAILSLVEEEISSDDREVIPKLAEKAGFDSNIFIEIIDRKKYDKTQIEGKVQELINSYNTLLKYVDGLEGIC